RPVVQLAFRKSQVLNSLPICIAMTAVKLDSTLIAITCNDDQENDWLEPSCTMRHLESRELLLTNVFRPFRERSK
ncbi:hypothetical protein CEXT_56291, partial [Caerostris extrusa]